MFDNKRFCNYFYLDELWRQTYSSGMQVCKVTAAHRLRYNLRIFVQGLYSGISNVLPLFPSSMFLYLNYHNHKSQCMLPTFRVGAIEIFSIAVSGYSNGIHYREIGL
jgi:uncharacterized RDD family membrane protein YckC